jgi:protein gp37
MGGGTGIEWTDATWNPIRGCRRTAPAGSKQSGCGDPSGGGCYAERQAARFCGPGQPYEGLITLTANGPRWSGKTRFVAEHLADPLRWRKPRRIFVDSMSDLFYEGFTNEQIAAVFGVMAACPQHTFQVLTKRAKRMREWFEWADPQGRRLLDRVTNGGLPPPPRQLIEDAALGALNGIVEAIPARGLDNAWPLRNVWLGASVENQSAAFERIPELQRTPAAVRFLSIEPMLGPVELDPPLCDYFDRHGDAGYCVADDGGTPWCTECDSERSYGHWLHLDGGIDWVIAGCESGPGARPDDVVRYRALRDQCAEAGVPFFLKQAVEDAMERCEDCGEEVTCYVHGPGDGSWSCGCTAEGPEFGGAPAIGAGEGSHRKRGGIIGAPYLDGVQHLAFPEVAGG